MNEKVDKKLLDIMKRSYYICEQCGKSGNLRRDTRMKVLCETCGAGLEIIEDI